MSAGHTERRSVQDYIDETPVWPDGTKVAYAPMTAMQWRIWWLAAAGKFFEGWVIFMTGVAMPMIAEEFTMNAAQHGLVGAAGLFGILVGALTLGGVADVFGRKLMFIAEMVMLAVFLAFLSISPSFPWLVLFLFGAGFALGCDYPTAHLIISESIPSNARGRLILAACGFQALGALIGTAAGYVILTNIPALSAWRYMYASAILPVLIVAVLRFSVTESAPWLLGQGRISEAERSTTRLLERLPAYPKQVILHAAAVTARQGRNWRDLFRATHRRALLLSSLPWFLQDLGTYGIGIFTPAILAASMGHATTNAHQLAAVIGSDEIAAKGAALIDVLLIIGICCAVLLADKVGRVPLQVMGFIGCAAGLLLASFSADHTGALRTFFIFAGFMLFNFMTNIGPNAQTYLLAGEVFPVEIRGTGAGFAAAVGKVGAVATAFLFPILLKDIGTQALLYALVGTSLLGAVLTWLFRIETTGVNLDQIGAADRAQLDQT